MNKCTNCGAEFEGKFCPNCGYNFVSPDEAEQKDEHFTATSKAEMAATKTDGLKKLFPLMRILPSLLIAAFSVLSMLFFLANAGTASAMGESEGFGSLYQVIGNGYGKIKAIMITMLIFNIIAFAFSVVAV